MSGKRLPLGLFKYDEYLPRTSIFWTLGRISWILDFTSLGATMFAKLAQTLFQHFSEKRKPFGLLCFDSFLPRVSGFWTLVKDFVDTWFQVILWSFVRWSCSYFVSAHSRESKTGWLTYCFLTSICLGPVFSGLWWRISRILNFTYLDAVMLARVAHTLFQYS